MIPIGNPLIRRVLEVFSQLARWIPALMLAVCSVGLSSARSEDAGEALSSGESGCRVYGTQIADLEGVISGSPYIWPTHESVAHYAAFSLHFKEPICVDAGVGGFEASHAGVMNIEIGVIDTRDYVSTRTLAGARVRCTGNLQPAISGYHVNSLILWGAACTAVSGE